MMTETRSSDRLISSDLSVGLPDPEPQLPLNDLSDRPSPDILRVLAIGSPPVVNGCGGEPRTIRARAQAEPGHERVNSS